MEADWYLDCSGFAGVLIEKTLDSPWEDWSNELLCDRALTCRKKKPEDPSRDPPPFTISTGMDAGWSWQIPFQANTGCGYVYSSSHITDDAARDELAQLVGVNELETSFKHLPGVLEPLLITLFGLLVGAIALSIMAPLYGLINQL